MKVNKEGMKQYHSSTNKSLVMVLKIKVQNCNDIMLSSSNCKSDIIRYHNYCIYSLSSNICNGNNIISNFGNRTAIVVIMLQ